MGGKDERSFFGRKRERREAKKKGKKNTDYNLPKDVQNNINSD